MSSFRSNLSKTTEERNSLRKRKREKPTSWKGPEGERRKGCGQDSTTLCVRSGSTLRLFQSRPIDAVEDSAETGWARGSGKENRVFKNKTAQGRSTTTPREKSFAPCLPFSFTGIGKGCGPRERLRWRKGKDRQTRAPCQTTIHGSPSGVIGKIVR